MGKGAQLGRTEAHAELPSGRSHRASEAPDCACAVGQPEAHAGPCLSETRDGVVTSGGRKGGVEATGSLDQRHSRSNGVDCKSAGVAAAVASGITLAEGEREAAALAEGGYVVGREAQAECTLSIGGDHSQLARGTG